MLEILQYVTSGFFVFLGCFSFTMSFLVCAGWGLNAVLLGIRGKRCGNIDVSI